MAGVVTVAAAAIAARDSDVPVVVAGDSANAKVNIAHTKERRVRGAVDEHYDFVWRSLRRLGIAEASADDAAQQVFCVFAKRVSDVPREKEKTFLFGVVMRVAQSSRRHHARHKGDRVCESDALEVLDAIASHGAGPDELLDEQRARQRLDAILEELPIEMRAVFVLYEIEEMTMAEIAKVLDLPPGTVASRLRRARELFESAAAGVGGAR